METQVADNLFSWVWLEGHPCSKPKVWYCSRSEAMNVKSLSILLSHLNSRTLVSFYIFFFPWAQGRLSSDHNILVNQKIKSMMKGSQVVLGRLIEPNFDKLLKKSRDHNTIFCSWISNAIEHGCIISLDISTLWCLMEIGIYVFYPLWPVDSLPW